ncbi:MAG: NAD(P)-dependent oxidoreductase [Piscinibacter sp.]|uniref:NAD(P)-dependent oxidoreductase n=1 Tax=Piscinibacter sp. TaxID=1903157 RepID=UPI001B6A5FAB|nr:NAD(P)-dependent oxidoreductase [Piscinibacter sp.]MBP5991482.1 NAD(P)-dependent oxidoreductase [Piscinibacter sp.]MBP6028695.1 NAD(P)-dependent oxidoreductase [Piscinibacter sp.]
MSGRIAVVGIGNMGLAMALRLRDRGFAVAVRDIAPAREALAHAEGLAVCDSPAAAAEGARAAIVAVVDAAQTEDVLFGAQGLAAALPRGAAVLLCPTIAPHDTERFAARLAEAGLEAIDAPMSGGPLRAREGTMSLMVACAASSFERQRDLIEALSGAVFRLGERPGDGARMKLVNNLLAGINLAGAAEVLALAERAGLDPALALDVIERSSGQSWIASDRMRRAIAGDLAPRAHTTLLNKDTHLALAMAQRLGLATPVGEHAAALFARACESGFAALDDASLFELLRRR